MKASTNHELGEWCIRYSFLFYGKKKCTEGALVQDIALKPLRKIRPAHTWLQNSGFFSGKPPPPPPTMGRFHCIAVYYSIVWECTSVSNAKKIQTRCKNFKHVTNIPNTFMPGRTQHLFSLSSSVTASWGGWTINLDKIGCIKWKTPLDSSFLLH